MMKVIQSGYIEQNALQEFFFCYRVTPYSSTQIPPGDLVYLHCIWYPLLEISNKTNSKSIKRTLQWSDSPAVQKLLEYTIEKCRPTEVSLNIGDGVFVKQSRQNKLSSLFKPYPYHIIGKKGTMLTAKHMSTNREITRNQTHFESVPETALCLKRNK